MGGSCGTGSEQMKEEEQMMDALLKDLWAEIHELGFFVVGIELFIELIILELIILLRMSEFSND